LGQIGGVIAGSHDAIAALRYSCAGLIYSTALPPAIAEGVREALGIIQNEAEFLHRRLWANHDRLHAALVDAGHEVASGGAPIAAVLRGSTESTLELTRQFAEVGLLTTPFVPPSVAPGKGAVRLIVGAKLDETGMDRVVEAVHEAAGVLCA
jgi:8-amino-7-oxononanoate synthase